MRDYTARPYQTLANDFLMQTPRCSLWAGMGLGKTVATLTALDTLAAAGEDPWPALVLGPLRVARDTWPAEQRKWAHLQDIKISPVVGAKGDRLRALRGGAHVYTSNYEQIPWLVEQFADRWPFRTVVADEATRLKGFRLSHGGKRAAALSKIAHLSDRWINLTGTPAPNGLKDLWGQTWFLDFGERLGSSYTAFFDRWFRSDPYTRSVDAFDHSAGEIHERLKDLCLTIDAKDWFDLDEPILRELRVTLPREAMKRYKQLEATMFTELLCGAEIEAFNAMALTNKCLQLANGAVYTDDKGAWAEVHGAKIEALESVLNEAGGMPILVAYQFVSDRERIAKHFGNKVAFLDKKAGFERFMKGDAEIGVAHPKSMGHGIDGLQDVTNILVRFGHDWNLEERQQMLERIGPVRQLQSGHKRPVFVYDIIAEKTLDQDVIDRHVSKRSVQDQLLYAMRRRAL